MMCTGCSESPILPEWLRKQARDLSSCTRDVIAKSFPDVIADQFLFLERSLEIARDSGVARSQIVLDPGFGFAKDSEENLQLMARFGELRALGFPLLVGTSRKRLIGHLVGADREARDAGTAAAALFFD